MTETSDTPGEVAVQEGLWSAGIGESFADAIRGSDVVEGYRLVKEKSELVGQPFAIKRVKFNPGLGASGFMASMECILHTNEPVVFNDGSTGVYRQVVAYLHEKGLIEVPEGDNGGPAGSSRYDTPLDKWLSPADAATVGKEEGFVVRLTAPRGLRVSEYEWGPGGEAETYYLG